MRDAMGNEVTGWMLATSAVVGIARGAAIFAVMVGIPLYFWGDEIGAWARQAVAFMSANGLS